MLDREAAARICEQSLQLSKADACEVTLGGGCDALTRFANNEVHQNMASESYELSVRSIFGKRTGRASTTRLDADGIRDAVETSERIARMMPELADLQELPTPQDYESVPGSHDASTAALDPTARAQRAAEIIEIARQAGYSAAGIVRTVEGEVGQFQAVR